MPIRLDDVYDRGRPGSSGSPTGLFGPRSEQPTEAEILKKEAFRLVSESTLAYTTDSRLMSCLRSPFPAEAAMCPAHAHLHPFAGQLSA